MTVVALLAKPPQPGVVLPELTDSTPLNAAEAADLYAAMLEDAMRTVLDSGGELLVNYRPVETLPEYEAEETVEAQLRGIAATATEAVDAIRFEPQVGATSSARVGNTIAHLLEEEQASSAAVLRPETPLLERTHLDSMAMKLRTNDVVLGPAADGGWYAAGFSAPIDFEDVLEGRPLETLTERASEDDRTVEFESMLPTLDSEAGLATVLSMLQARTHADRPVPAATTAMVEQLGIELSADGEILRRE
jgi:glycosyltransferase A (GT-A) superfamily protein (DUF2064 family)